MSNANLWKLTSEVLYNEEIELKWSEDSLHSASGSSSYESLHLHHLICTGFHNNVVYVQTQIVAAAAAGVAAEGLSPRTARVEAEAAASLSMSLAENALVLLMLVEDHLRLESQFYYSTISSKQANGSTPITPTLSAVPSRRHSAIGIEKSGPALDISASRRLSSVQDTGSLSLEVNLLFH